VAKTGYPVLAGDRSIPIVGGAEVQQAFIAPELARRGYDVSMISMDFGQRDGDLVNGVRVLKMHAPKDGVPVLRFLYPRLTSLWSAMRRADADVYYLRSAGGVMGFIVRFAQFHQRLAIFASASDLDFDPNLPLIGLARDRALYRYGVRNAHRIVVQSERQAQICRQTFMRDSVVVNSCYSNTGKPGDRGGVILWVGRVHPVKRPELFLDIAQRLPQYRFRLVGGSDVRAADFVALCNRARALGNVEMPGFVPYADVEPNFDGASLLVNTSVSEGFPNTFMQAWSRGIPTVSFFDPNVQINGVDVGTVVPDLDAMERAVLRFKTDPVVWHEQGARVAEHFRLNYTVGRTVDAYERIFGDLVHSSRLAPT
jgi:glycosyltransferase involved in cell wall biosynthesis